MSVSEIGGGGRLVSRGGGEAGEYEGGQRLVSMRGGGG